MPTLDRVRSDFHASMNGYLLTQRGAKGSLQPKFKTSERWGGTYPVMTCADGDNIASVILSDGVGKRVGAPLSPAAYLEGGESGTRFERLTAQFLDDSLALFKHLLPRPLTILSGSEISDYAQFSHLARIQEYVEKYPELEAAFGGEYLVDPDILISFDPDDDASLNAGGAGLSAGSASHSFTRASYSYLPILHASVSCKWTMRRDRAQNSRLEALNLVRNRKGRLPHIAMVTMECDPEILASLCLGTGDIDCVYHAALHELLDTAETAAKKWPKKVGRLDWPHKHNRLTRLIDGSRLRDISDLPLDLLT
jgi:hypothetical protein